MKENKWSGGCTRECFTLLKHVHNQSWPRFSDRGHRTFKRQSNVFFTQQLWLLDEVSLVWSFFAGILSIQIALMQISTLSTRPFSASVHASHDSLLLLISEINMVKYDCWFQLKRTFTLWFPYLSAVIRRIPYVPALWNLGFNTIHETIHVAFINGGWICDLLRIEDLSDKAFCWVSVGFVFPHENHTLSNSFQQSSQQSIQMMRF